MKILQVGPNSVHVSSFIKALSEEQQQHLFLLSEETCHFKGIEEEFVVNFRSLNPISILKNYKKLGNILKSLKPDIIHIHQINRLAYFVSRAAKKRNIPVITTAWGSDVLLIPKQNKFYYFLVKQTLRLSEFVTADSQEMIKSMNEIHPSPNYVLLQYGIDPVEPKKKEKIIYSNRLHEPLYRIQNIISYYRDFSILHPEWKLIVAGNGSETKALKEQILQYGLDSKVEFVGWVQKPENHEWYASAGIYISIPESDGTSVSLLEAMSAGCIPVVSDLPVSREWIVQGKNGVIESNNQNPLIEALKIDVGECAEINQLLIASKATRKASLDIFLNLYRKALNG